MTTINLTKEININDNGEYIVDFLNNELGFAELFIGSHLDVFLDLKNINDITKLNIYVSKFSNVKINFLVEDKSLDINIKSIIDEEAKLEINSVDLAESNVKLFSNSILFGNKSASYWNLSSLANKSFKKKYEVSFSHIGLNSISNMQNYGVCANESNMTFTGTSHIEKVAIKSNAKQVAKIIIYDEKCKAKSNPILKIDIDDVVASHGACVGTLNDEHLYYLCSRGIEESEAKSLITYGYLKPIFKKFDEQTVEKLSLLLEERM